MDERRDLEFPIFAGTAAQKDVPHKGDIVRVTKDLGPVMVRRLKEDPRKLAIEGFPERNVVQMLVGIQAGPVTRRLRRSLFRVHIRGARKFARMLK